MSYCAVTAGFIREQSSASDIRPAASTIVIIDPSIEAPESLANGIASGANVYILEPQRDGIEQITRILQVHREKIALTTVALHIISHGSPGILYLGAAQLDLATIDRYATQLKSWFAVPGAELLLYGCNVATGDAGAEFLEKLYDFTGASIAASSTPIGHRHQGGNWVLDTQRGSVTAPPAFQNGVLENYSGLLATTASIARLNPTSASTNADNVTFQVTFSEGVQNVDPTDFVLSGGNTTGASIAVTQVTPLVYNVAVTGITGYNGTLNLDFATGQNITAVAGGTPFVSTNLTAEEEYSLDNTPPTLVSFLRQPVAGANTNADVLVFRATFNETVINVDPSDFVVTGTTASILGVSSVAGSPGVYDITVAGGNLTNLPSGTVGINLSPTSNIRDVVGNALVIQEPTPENDQTYNVDNVAATVVNVSAVPASATPTRYNTGDQITLAVEFSEAITVVQGSSSTSLPQLILETGAVDAIATYSGVDATNPKVLLFTYTVQAGNTSPDLAYQSTTALMLNGSAIRDAAGNNAVLNLPTPGTTGSLNSTSEVIVDTTAPTLVSFVRQTPAGAVTNADTLVFQVTFNEGVNNVLPNADPLLTIDDFVVTGGSTATVTSVTPGSSPSVYNVTVSGAGLTNFNGTVGLALAAQQDIVDLAGNPLLPTQPATNQAYTVDNTSATVVKLTSPTANGRYNEGDLIQITVEFSEVVTVTGAPRLLLGNGATGATANYTSGSGSKILTFTYVVAAGDTSADLNYVDINSLQLGNGGAIQDVAGNDAALTLPALDSVNSLGASKNLVVDTTAPSLLSFTRQNPTINTTNVDSLTFQVSFSEAVQSVDISDFTVGGLTTATVISVIPVGTDGTVYNVTVSGGDLANFNGSVGLNLSSTRNITDLAGNALPVAEPAGDPLVFDQAYNVDNTAPTVSGVSSPALDKSYKAGESIAITIQFSETVNVTGTPQLTLETGVSDRLATYTGGSGSNTLTFTYIVQAGDTAADLDYHSAAALALNGGMIRDLAGNNANVSLAAPGATGSLAANKNLVVDTTTPNLLSIIRQTPSAATTNLDSVTFRVTFSETMVGVDGADFVVTGATGTSVAVTPVGSSATVYDVTVSGGNLAAFNGDVGLNLAAQQNITDVALNALPTVEPTTDQLYTIDNVAPTVLNVTSPTANGRYNAGDVLQIAVKFSEKVAVTGIPQLTLETGITDRVATYASGSGSDTLVFTYTVQAGDTNADLEYVSTAALVGTIQDAAGNVAILTLPAPGTASSLGANKDLIIDTAAPVLTALTRQTPLAPITNADSLVYRVTFNEAVLGVDVSDFVVFALGPNPLTATVSTVTPVQGTGNTVYDVTISGGNLANYSGDLQLNLATGQNITDLAGNSLPSAPPALNEVYSLDNTLPTVTSVTSAAADTRYNAGDLIPITITFSEIVTVSGTPQLVLETGTNDAIADYVSGSGTNTLTFNYTVGTGENSSDLDYRSTVALMLNGGTIRDAGGNNANLTLPTPGAATSLGGSKSLIVDTTAPSVTSIVRQNPGVELTNADSLVFRVAFSEAVTNIDTADFVVNGSTSATVTNVLAVNGSTTVYDVTVSGGDLASVNGPIGLNLAPAQNITDLAGNLLPLVEPAPANDQTYNLDNIQPTVTNVSATTANGRYNAGDTIAITLEFSEVVTVTGAPRLTLATGGTTGALATYSGGSGTNTLTFTYTVRAGETSADLDYANTTALDLNSGSIRDAAGNLIDVALAAPGTANSLGANKDLIVDTTAPSLTAIARQLPTTNPTNADSLTYRVTFGEDVQGVDAADFVVDSTSTAAVSGVTQISNSIYDVTVAGGNLATFNGTVGLNLATAQNITDLAGNALPTTAESAAVTDERYTLDNTAATVVSVTSTTADGQYNAGDVIVVTVQFSEVVNVVGTPQLTLETGTVDAIAEYTGGDGTNTLTFTYTIAAGQNSSDLTYISTSALTLNGGTIQDTSGNDANLALPAPNAPTTSLGGSKALVVDTIAPTMLSIERQTPTDSPTNADSLTFKVTFSEAVEGVDVSDFTVNGIPSASITSVTGSGAVYSVVVADAALASFNGTVGLNLAGTQNITDGATNALLPGEPTTDQTFTLDNTQPTILGVSSSTNNGSYNTGDTVSITVQFSESVNVTGTPQLALETGTTDAIATYASGSGTDTLTFTYTVAAGNSTPDLDYTSTNALTLNSGTIGDAAGNAADLTLPAPGAGNSLGANKDLIIDTTAPTLTAITRQDPIDQLTSTDSLVYRVSFSEAVTGVTADDFAVVGGTTATVTNVTSIGVSVYDVTVSGGNLATFTGTVGLSLATGQPGQNIIDVAGNALPTVEPTTDETYTLDNSGPTVVRVSSLAANGSYKVGDVIDITLEMSEVTNVAGAPRLALETGTTDAVADYFSGSGTNVLTFRYVVGQGDVSEDLNYVSTTALSLNGGSIQDVSGNDAVLTLPALDSPNSLGSIKNIVLDSAPPQLTAIALQTPNTSATNADSLVFRLTFSEVVQNVDATDFQVNGTSGATVTGVTPVGGTMYDVTVSGGNLANFNGTVGLDLATSNNIIDAVDYALLPGEPDVDQVYTLDNVVPTVTSILRKTPTTPVTGASSVVFTVNFSEAVEGVNINDFRLNRTGNLQATVASVSANQGNAIDVTVNITAGQGDLRLDVLSGATIADAAGQTLAGGFTTGEVYTLDTALPSVSCDMVAATLQDGRFDAATGRLFLRFNEAVTGLGKSDLRLTRNGVALNLDRATLTANANRTVYTLSNLAPLTTAQGRYSFTLRAAGAGIADATGNALTQGGSMTWLRGVTALQPPAIQFVTSPLGRKFTGSRANETVRGTSIHDILYGQGGKDAIFGLGGDDRLSGSGGNDVVYGGLGNDQLVDGTGDDVLYGEVGNDFLFGNAGNDTLLGGDGADILNGGTGTDVLTAGKGRDIFRYNTLQDGGDTIRDFQAGQDLIDLSEIFKLAGFRQGTPFARFIQYVRLEAAGTSTRLQIDRDGVGTGQEFVTLATVQNVRPGQLSSNNFVITQG
ncbi:DUF4347 domain-containing protein [Leptolyngbya sp. FACHB-16]|uniref:DUF4347 domain-containing protein n=1 Tax=unclassified Leptolyngbya TaxID=2650499 RepID=UPI001684F368|nr:DUF4347 domain-containing protein [Leptolyngbya sp. FACHB-16]MBD2155078.1 DUF4347 domain-containing protein [Leptolyngbya sp. FACHB-16]